MPTVLVMLTQNRRGGKLHVVHTDDVLAQELIHVEKGSFDHHIAAQHAGRHHLTRWRCLDSLLPRVSGTGHNVTELESPRYSTVQYSTGRRK
jgi:hypothetical protein